MMQRLSSGDRRTADADPKQQQALPSLVCQARMHDMELMLNQAYK
jgi:hypothetical protein